MKDWNNTQIYSIEQIGRKKMNAQDRYDRTNTKQFKMKLNLKTVADIIDWLSKQENKQGAIKALIRKEINAKK